VAKALRKIESKFWFKTQPPPDWVSDGDIIADPVTNLQTRGCRLSIYEFDDDSKIDRIVAALALTRNRLQSFDFIIFDLSLLEDLHIEMTIKQGDGFDSKVQEWHRDLVELSALKIVEFCKALKDAKPGTRYKERLRELVRQGIISGQIDVGKLENRNSAMYAELVSLGILES